MTCSRILVGLFLSLMITVQAFGASGQFGDLVQHLPDGKLDVVCDLVAGHVHYALLFQFTVAHRGLNFDFFFIIDGHTVQGCLEAGDDIVMPLEELDRLLAFARVNHLVVNSQGVVQADD